MVKFLLISFLVCYLLYKIGGYLFKMFFWSLGNKMNNPQNFNRPNPNNRRPKNSNVDVEYFPGKNDSKKKSKDFKGGEYVDYEEIK